MDKDAVSALNASELTQFPLDDFFDHYEKGLRKVVLLFVCVCLCFFNQVINSLWASGALFKIDYIGQ